MAEPEQVPEIVVTPGPPRTAPCPHCGEPAGLARGEITKDGIPYGVYVLDWCSNGPQPRALLSLSIGDWSPEGTAADRTMVGVEMEGEGWRLTDAPERGDLHGWGEFAPDAEVRRREAVDQVRALAQLVMAGDPVGTEVNEWAAGRRDVPLPGTNI